LRVDAITPTSRISGRSNFLPVGDTQTLRLMPTVGLEIAPFIMSAVGQRPRSRPIAGSSSSQRTGAAASPTRTRRAWCSTPAICFRSTSLRLDRVEGGGRANVRVQATRSSTAAAVKGGRTAYQCSAEFLRVADVTYRPGFRPADAVSDYVASVQLSPNRTYTFSVRRAWMKAMQVNRSKRGRPIAAGRSALLYGNYAAQPELGYLTRREGCSAALVQMAATGCVGLGRWNLEANQINHRPRRGLRRTTALLAANYVTVLSYTPGGTPPVLAHAYCCRSCSGPLRIRPQAAIGPPAVQ